MKKTIISALLLASIATLLCARSPALAQQQAQLTQRWEYASFEPSENTVFFGIKACRDYASVAAALHGTLSARPTNWEVMNLLGSAGFELVLKDENSAGVYFIFKRPIR